MATRWFEVLAKVLPWLDDDRESDRLVREEAAEITAEQEALAPVVKSQNAYLVPRGEKNGFTTQLGAAFHSRFAEE